MKRMGCFVFVLICASWFFAGDADAFRYQVDSAGRNQYAIQVLADSSTGSTELFRLFKQKATEVCVGTYTILQIDRESTTSFFGIVACESQQPVQQSPSFKDSRSQQTIQSPSPRQQSSPGHGSFRHNPLQTFR